jgi:hypothetical protein
MKSLFVSCFLLLGFHFLHAQQPDTLIKPAEKEALKFNLNQDGSHFFQVTLLNQTWLRFNQSNAGTTILSKPAENSFDIGLRRTRIQLFGQINDRCFIYFQIGQNNFNAMSGINGNRKIQIFFHDAVGEYKVSKNNQLKLGAGLTIANGLSRFSQPSIGTIMTLDVPVFAQATVDQTDEFSRKLSVYARGQVGKIDYRLVLSDPFPINSNGTLPPAIANFAQFTPIGHTKQIQGHVLYQFFEHEAHQTPYMVGTYLGKKKIFNIGAGAIYQPNATWRLNGTDTIYEKMLLLCVESFLDIPVNKAKQTAISAYIGYFNYNYGKNYMRYNGIMNPANGSNASNLIAAQGNTYGNAFPMFGTGQAVYAQIGYLLPKDLLKTTQLLPYVSTQIAKWDRLDGKYMSVFNVGASWLIKGHKAKLSIEYQNRPTYKIENTKVVNDARKSSLTLQYQLFF